VVIYKTTETEENHMLGIVDTANDALLVAKIVLRDATDLDERNFNLYNSLTKESVWNVARLGSLENFNKSQVGLLGIESCLLKHDLLDLSGVNDSERFLDITPSKKDLKKRGFPANDS
jgi:hypothetical protein